MFFIWTKKVESFTLDEDISSTDRIIHHHQQHEINENETRAIVNAAAAVGKTPLDLVSMMTRSIRKNKDGKFFLMDFL